MKVLGIDLSLRSTGLAILSTDGVIPEPRKPDHYSKMKCVDGAMVIGGRLNVGIPLGMLIYCVEPPVHAEMARWDYILESILGLAVVADFVLMEGQSHGSAFSGSGGNLLELRGVVRYHLGSIGKPEQQIAPSTLKKFITGDGHADKNVVIKEVWRRWGVDLDNDDMADALGIAVAGVGIHHPPAAERMTAESQAIVNKLRNPEPKKPKGKQRRV